jgi:hypothetical protein
VSARVTFQVTTYFKRPKGETGLTRAGSVRLSAGDALGWVLAELPGEAVTVSHDQGTDIATVVIDWSKVPDEIRDGRAL